MNERISLIYPPGYDRDSEVKMKDFKFIHSLQIDDMIILKKESYRGFADLKLENFFTTDPEVLCYRLAVVQDLVENDELYQIFCKAVSIIFNISDMRCAMRSEFTMDSALSSIRTLEMYQEIVDLFANGLKNAQICSEGMKQFRKQILTIAESEEYQHLSVELPKMELNLGYLKSITIGINLDENLRPKEAEMH